MEAFLYQQQQQQQSLFLDSVYCNSYLANSPIEISLFNPHQNGDLSNVSSCFDSYNNSSEAMQDSPTSSLQVSLEKKRKQGDRESCLSSAQSKGTKESKSKKKNHNNGGSRKCKANKDLKGKKETTEEAPLGYIHVRARRGQATDSHSLAERVRRERISERMKKLKELVPGCDKLIGKALVLDEIINYVQSLQNQVEFLSMKIASLNPILYNFGVGFDDYMSQPEEMGSTSQPMPPVIQSSHIPPTAFEGTTNNLQEMVYGQGPQNFSQDSGSFLMQVGDIRRSLELNNMCSFQ